MQNSAKPTRFFRAADRLVKYISLQRKKSKAFYGNFCVGRTAGDIKEIEIQRLCTGWLRSLRLERTIRPLAWWTRHSAVFAAARNVPKPIGHGIKNEGSPGERLAQLPGLSLISASPTGKSTISLVDAKWVRPAKRDAKMCLEYQRN